MKKRDLLLTGAMLFGMSLSTQAQEQLFFFGFEDGTASFTDSANALDSITQLQYYSHQGSNGAGLKPEEFELGPTYDTTMLVLNGIAPMGSRGDSYDIIEDLEGGHRGEFEAMGAEGGERYFKYMAGGELGGTACNDYEANLFVRALPISDYTSYRLSMYIKASAAEGQMNIDLLRGFYNSEKQFSMSGEQNSGEFKLVKTTFETERWERVTMMSYYQNDSVANRYMYQAGYWWTNSWLKNIDGTDYNMIVQPDQYFVRLSFSGPGVTYYVDDMALTKSWIAGAEYNKNIMRVDFGYDTNLKELADKSAVKALYFPAENISITGEELGEEYELEIASAEYHNDGYLYIWIDQDDDFEYYENVKVSFKNPEDDLQLTYDGDLYPMGHDTIWAQTKIVPDFSGEPAFFNPSISAISLDQFPPTYVSSVPEEGSFNLESSTTSFDVTFNKKIYVNTDAYDPSDTTSVIVKMIGNGKEEIWVPTAYNEDTYTVTFSRQAGNTSALAGDYEFEIIQARASVRGPQAEKKVLTLSFGAADVKPNIFAKIDFAGFNKGTNTIEGLAVNASCMMEVAEFQGAYTKALKFGLYGANLQNGAPVLTYTFNVSEAGEWLVKYGTSGCLKNSWNDGCKMVVTVIDPVTTDTLDIYTEENTNNKPEEGGVVSKVDEQVRTVKFPAAGEYQLVFTLPNENSYGGGHKGGRVLYYVEVSNAYSRAYAYIEKYEKALNTAKELIASASATPKYTGSYLDDFKAAVAKHEGFSSTSPTEYDNTVSAINDATAAMNSRIGTVDTYYAAYTAALSMDTLYKDSVGYNEMAAFKAVQKAIADYAELDVTINSNEELKTITDGINATTKGMTDRCAAVDAFNANIEDSESIFDENNSLSFLSEYKKLQDVYNANKDLAKYAVSDEELKATNDAFSAAINAFNGKLNAANTLTAQVKGLAKMADALVTDWGTVDKADLDNQIAVELDDNQALANVYQLAIKAALEAMMADGGIDEAGIVMTDFIRNNILYTTSTKQKVAENEDPLPGWEVPNARGNAYFGLPWSNQAANEGKPAVNSWIGLDWNSGVTMSQTLNNLPAGLYTIECGFSSKTPQGNLLIEQFDANGELVQSDTCVWAAGSELMGEASLNQTFQFEAQGVTTVITADAFSSGSWGGFDKWALTLNEPLKGYDYAAAAAASAEAMNQAYTGVGSVAAPSKVQFYNLNGMQVAEPNKGVNIRISTGANGQRTVEKILVK